MIQEEVSSQRDAQHHGIDEVDAMIIENQQALGDKSGAVMEKGEHSNPKSYRDAFMRSERWQGCFHEWGLKEFEDLTVDDPRSEVEDSEEIPVILLDAETKKRLFEPWKYSLIGKDQIIQVLRSIVKR